MNTEGREANPPGLFYFPAVGGTVDQRKEMDGSGLYRIESLLKGHDNSHEYSFRRFKPTHGEGQ